MNDVSENAVKNAPDEAKDRQAARLRAEGMSFREIAKTLQTDVAMVHRRVRREAVRQQQQHERRMQAMRDDDLDKLRRMERAILSDAYQGDREALRLVLRIMRMRQRLLNDTSTSEPLAEVEADAASDNVALSDAAPSDVTPSVESPVASEDVFLESMELDFPQAEVAKVFASNHGASTKGSTPPSTVPSTAPSTRSNKPVSRQARRRAERQARRRAQKLSKS